MQKSIVGIGSALVDLIVQLENDQLLDKLGLPKGSMTLVDANKSNEIIDATKQLKTQTETGGSAANTMRGIAQLKGKAAYIGKLNNDETGAFFKQSFEDLGIILHWQKGTIPTGVAATLITPDTERTFGTYLGAASELSLDDLSDEMFAPYDYLHVEGYLVFNHELIEGILKMAKKNGLMISLDMASYNVVEADLDFMKHLVRNYVDIVFANEEEAKAYTQKEPKEAVEEIGNECEIAIVKVGKEGSLIKTNGKTIMVESYTVKAIDTNGAGDVYASGFLYGLANNWSIDQCGKLGSLLASEVIQVIGAKIPEEAFANMQAEIERIIS